MRKRTVAVAAMGAGAVLLAGSVVALAAQPSPSPVQVPALQALLLGPAADPTPSPSPGPVTVSVPGGVTASASPSPSPSPTGPRGTDSNTGSKGQKDTATPVIDLVDGTKVDVVASGFTRAAGAEGIYVGFAWKDHYPSEGSGWGSFGPDADSQRFIAWPGAATAFAASGQFDGDGLTKPAGFTATGIVVRSEFDTKDFGTIDCRVKVCGIITIGAHGMAAAQSETFVPVHFVAGAAAPSSIPAARDPHAGVKTAAPTKATPLSARPRLATLAAGSAQTLQGTGFVPAEDVTVGLDSLGMDQRTVTASGRGAVSTTFTVPADTTSGTHTVALTGTASGRTARARFTVTAGAAPTAGPQLASTGVSPGLALAGALLLGGGLALRRRA